MKHAIIGYLFQALSYFALAMFGAMTALGHRWIALGCLMVGHFAFHAAVYFHNPYNE